MYVDSQNIINVDLEKIEEYIKNVLKLIQDSSKQVINKITNKNNVINENKIKHNISLLFQEMNEISLALKRNDLFYDEYFEFCEIEDMIKYTLNRNFLIISEPDLDFILNLVINFFNLIQFKVKSIENNSFDEKKFEPCRNHVKI